MKDWRSVVVSHIYTIYKTIEAIDQGALQIALVVNDDYQLLGTVTDGDIRRAILRGISFDGPVTEIMNAIPTVMRAEEGYTNALAVMRKKNLHHLPLIDGNHRLVGMEFIDDTLVKLQKDNYVVLMAGGMGTRLQPLTQLCPKPMLSVGGKPILECILDSFIEQGFIKFFFTLNYKGEMIEDYFGDGSRWGVNIEYIKEKERLGTAGALTLLHKTSDKPILVMNGDILTKIDFKHLLDFHAEQNSAATICVREYNMQVPYGVVNVSNNFLECIKEKPQQRFLVNAGVYVLNPATLKYIPTDSYFDMPDLLNRLLDDQKRIGVFPIREYWIDIGHADDYEKANMDFPEVFG